MPSVNQEQGDQTGRSAAQHTSSPQVDVFEDQGVLHRAFHVLNRLNCVDISKLRDLVCSWIQTGVNLPLAGPFVASYADALYNCPWRLRTALLRPGSNEHVEALSQRARFLSRNTCKAIVLSRDSTFDEYIAQMVGDNLRWETMGIFFTAAGRATLDTVQFPTLFASSDQQMALAKTLTYIGDCCLEICLALDCLNDLQAILQYENFILHSQVHGDQSKSIITLWTLSR